MSLEADDAARAVEAAEQIIKSSVPEHIVYKPFLSAQTTGFLATYLSHRRDFPRDLDEHGRELVDVLSEKFDVVFRKHNYCFERGHIPFTLEEVNFVGGFLKKAIERERDRSSQFCRNAVDAFLELRSSFVLAGGWDSREFRELGEAFRKIGKEAWKIR